MRVYLARFVWANFQASGALSLGEAGKGHVAFVEVQCCRWRVGVGRGGTGETYRDKCLRRFVPAVLEACWRTKLSKFSSFFRRKVQIVNLKGSGEAEKTLGGGNGRLKRPIVVSVRRHFCLFLFFFPKFLCEHTLSIFWKPLYTFYFFCVCE